MNDGIALAVQSTGVSKIGRSAENEAISKTHDVAGSGVFL
jgi:hypothetical protein